MNVSDLNFLISQLLPEPHAGLLSGILFGTKATLSTEFQQALIATGTLHIIALSGMNITIVAGMSNYLLMRLFSRRVASVLTIISIIAYVWFVGISASVVRAAIMASLALVAIGLGKQRWAIWGLILAVCSMLALYPPWINDVGFQLSVLATLGIILFSKTSQPAGVTHFSETLGNPYLEYASHIPPRSVKPRKYESMEIVNLKSAGLRRSLKWLLLRTQKILIDDLQLTLSAQVFTIPLILFQFHRVSIISPLPNVLIGWVLGPLTGLGFATVAAAILYLPLGQILAWFTWVPLEYIISVIKWTSQLPFASVGF